MNKRRKIGLFGGSFDPVHVGHMIIASYIVQWCDVDEVWMMLSPMNPFKRDRMMESDANRLAMLRIAVSGAENISVTDVELSMPQPSYTINTLERLCQLYPDYDFRLIVGSDNLAAFDRWREGERIIRDFGLIVYPRPDYELPSPLPEGVTVVDAPLVEISSTFVRDAIKHHRNMNFFLPPGVYDYILTHNLYSAHVNQ